MHEQYEYKAMHLICYVTEQGFIYTGFYWIRKDERVTPHFISLFYSRVAAW